MPKVSDADLAYYAKFGGVSDIPDMARELIAARQVIEAVAALLDEWDDAAYCTSCGIRQCETGHGDEHHDGCKRTAVEHALRPLGRRG